MRPGLGPDCWQRPASGRRHPTTGRLSPGARFTPKWRGVPYFGDARDYLKYHLLEDLFRAVPRLERLVILWMLTAPDGTGEGNVVFAECSELPELTAFLA
jgi:hypothetical protein